MLLDLMVLVIKKLCHNYVNINSQDKRERERVGESGRETDREKKREKERKKQLSE